ncbi:hypothetical protein ACFPJ1_21145 [Kribbella qitaiheensis]|uniref:hypothetical protein n=1 Tax=Kribbella qitaiheensis TaxID=1544730 RepID=UPI00360FDB03
MSWRLVPDDEAFALMYRRAENLLQGLSRVEHSTAAEAGPGLLPTALTGGEALGALQRAGEVLRDALDAFSVPPDELGQSTRPRVFAEGRQRMPLRIVWISHAAIETLAAALRVINLALAPVDRAAVLDPDQRRRLDDLAELLDDFAPDLDLWTGTPHPPGRKELLQPLARLIALLDLPGDDDTTVLLAVLQANPDADVELTTRQAAAYDRVAERINLLLTDGDPLHQILF